MNGPDGGWIERLVTETARGDAARYRPGASAHGPLFPTNGGMTMTDRDSQDLVPRLQAVLARGADAPGVLGYLRRLGGARVSPLPVLPAQVAEVAPGACCGSECCAAA